MNDIISINEVRIKLAIKSAETALQKARAAYISGKNIPEDLIPRLENVIQQLEEQLKDLIERGY